MLLKFMKSNQMPSFFPAEFEASFIRLLDRVTNGSRIEINETGMVISLGRKVQYHLLDQD